MITLTERARKFIQESIANINKAMNSKLVHDDADLITLEKVTQFQILAVLDILVEICAHLDKQERIASNKEQDKNVGN